MDELVDCFAVDGTYYNMPARPVSGHHTASEPQPEVRVLLTRMSQEASFARVKALFADGYPQIKRSAEEKWPAIIVVYNNSGEWNWIDAFTRAT